MANYPDAASNWIELVFANNTTSTVYSHYSNNSIEIDDPELSVTLSNYISRSASIQGTRDQFLLVAVQEIRDLMDQFIVREYNEGTASIYPVIDVNRFMDTYQNEADLQETIYRLYLLSRTSVSLYEFLEGLRAELEALIDRKIVELEIG